MLKKCAFCGKDFSPKRASAKYCNDNCRKSSSRGLVAPPTEINTVNVYEVDKEVAAIAAKQRQTGTTTGATAEAYDYEKNLEKFKKMGLVETTWITTGIRAFDELTMIPRGRVTQIQGPLAVGKTTLALNMIKGINQKGHSVFYVDSEASLNPELLAKMEIEPELFMLYNKSAYIEDIYDEVVKAVDSGLYDMVILDSLASTTFKTEEEGEVFASNIGQKAKVVNKLMRVIPMKLKNTDTALVIINQERETIGSYVPQKYTPGGMAVPYAASLMVSLKTIKSWRFPREPKDGVYQGHEVEVEIIKSKVNQPWRKSKFKLYYPQPTKHVPDYINPDTGELMEAQF